jgi:predicted kinase
MKQKNPQLLILVGAPGSGKSTFARYFLRTEENWVRVCRDDFRAMQFEGTKASDKTEAMITYAIDKSIETFLVRKMNVLVDATHCRKEYLKQYVSRFHHLADIQFKVFESSYEELLQRCEQREAKTGKHIPKPVLKKYIEELENLKSNFDFSFIPRKRIEFELLQQDETKQTCFLFDLDGTLAKANGRTMFNPTNEEIMTDTPIMPVVEILKSLKQQHQIIFVSGREETSLEGTKQWLQQHVMADEPITLFMRAAGDYRRDSIIKKEFLHQHILPNYNVLGAFDDRLQVVRECWNEEKIFCFNVNQLLEEF